MLDTVRQVSTCLYHPSLGIASIGMPGLFCFNMDLGIKLSFSCFHGVVV